MSYFQTPSIWEILKGAWPMFWGLSKMLWPVWVMAILLGIFKLFVEKKVKLWKLKSVKKKCPECAEWIPKEAKKCGHCGKIF